MTIRRFILLVTTFIGFGAAVFVLYVVADRSAPLQTVKVMETTLPSNKLSFPYLAENSSVVLRTVSAYEGPYLEDGTDDEVVNIASLQIYNSGAREIMDLHIELLWESGCYVFEGNHIPPNSTVLLLEKNRALYCDYDYLVCNVQQECSIIFENDSLIEISDEGLGTLVVRNLTNDRLLDVNIYYKSWLNPPDIYIGGITYMVEIDQLLPQQKVLLTPDHYACGYNKVVTVTMGGK